MNKFIDGPAAGIVLQLRRSPLFLRVVHSDANGWDGLDQHDDKPADNEDVHTYVRRGQPVRYHLNTGKRSGSGFFEMADYQIYRHQPPPEVVRNTLAWRQWTLAQVGKTIT